MPKRNIKKKYDNAAPLRFTCGWWICFKFFVTNASPDWNKRYNNFRLFETSNLVLWCSEQNRHMSFEITDIFKVVKGSKFLKKEKELLFHFYICLYLKTEFPSACIFCHNAVLYWTQNGLQDRFGHFKGIWKYAHCTDSYSHKCSEQISTSISQQLLWSTFIITALHCRRTWQWCWIIMV